MGRSEEAKMAFVCVCVCVTEERVVNEERNKEREKEGFLEYGDQKAVER